MRKHSLAIATMMTLCLAWVPSQAFAHGHDQEAALTPQARQDLAALRAATAPAHDFAAATAPLQWDTPITLCMSSAEGGMGYHYAKMDNFGVFDPARPQSLLFEPQQDGSMRLVAVEYLFFDGDNTDDPNQPNYPPPPPMFGQEFHHVPGFDVWALHAWVWRHNPAGMFADWNPNVSCEFGVPQP